MNETHKISELSVKNFRCNESFNINFPSLLDNRVKFYLQKAWQTVRENLDEEATRMED